MDVSRMGTGLAHQASDPSKRQRPLRWQTRKSNQVRMLRNVGAIDGRVCLVEGVISPEDHLPAMQGRRPNHR